MPSQTIKILSSEFKISKMFSNSHDQDICAELRHDIVSSYDSSMITNTTMDNTKSLPKSKFEMII